MSKLFQAIGAAGQGEVSLRDTGWYARDFLFAADFPGFQGHFPGNPVLPAFVQMMAAAHLASAWLGGLAEVSAVKHAKFLIPIQPGQVLTLLARPHGMNEAEVKVMLEDRLASTFILGLETPA